MTTITRFTNEQLIAHTEALIESQRQCIPGANDPENVRTYEMDIAVLESALASLTTEPVAWTDADELRDAKNGGNGYLFAIGGNANKFADPRRQMMLYAAPPAPVVPWAWQQWIADAAEYLEGGLEADGELEAEGSIEAKRLLSRRAAMLQGSQPVSNRDELPVIAWLRSDYNSDDKRDPNAPLFMLGSNDPSETWGVEYLPLMVWGGAHA